MAHLRHQLSILGVDSGYGSDVLTVLQGLEELTVPQHERVLIGHEHLEGIHSFLSHQLLHLSTHLEDVNVRTTWSVVVQMSGCKTFKNMTGRHDPVSRRQCRSTLGPHQVTPTCRA